MPHRWRGFWYEMSQFQDRVILISKMMPWKKKLVKRLCFLVLVVYLVDVCLLWILKLATPLMQNGTAVEIFAGPAITIVSTFIIMIGVRAVMRRFSKYD